MAERRRRRKARRAITQVPETLIAAVKDGERVRLKGRAVTRVQGDTLHLMGMTGVMGSASDQVAQRLSP